MDWLMIDDVGLVAARRVVAMARTDAGGVARLMRDTPPERVIILTGGRKRRSVLILDSGHLVVTALSIAQLAEHYGTTNCIRGRSDGGSGPCRHRRGGARSAWGISRLGKSATWPDDE
jgi:regulator of extracellular matrix RemA (YlzA/DUF370 family)